MQDLNCSVTTAFSLETRDALPFGNSYPLHSHCLCLCLTRLPGTSTHVLLIFEAATAFESIASAVLLLLVIHEITFKVYME